MRVLGFTALATVLVSAALQGTGGVPPARCEGQKFEVFTVPGGYSPYIRLNADDQNGSFLLDYGSTQSSLSQDDFQRPSGGDGKISISSFSLPTFHGGRFVLRPFRQMVPPPGGQLGVVGTDFLSLLNADFSFSNGAHDVMLGAKTCSPDVLRKRGMIGVKEAGFFSSDPRRVDARRPNVPVLFVKIGGVSTWAQIDTGNDDGSLGTSIDINNAFYDRLVAAGATLQWTRHVRVATCNGFESRPVYELASGDITLTSDDGREILKLTEARLLRKEPNGCGGIANMAEPAAQLGASVLTRLGSVVFDPKAETVWVHPAEQRTALH